MTTDRDTPAGRRDAAALAGDKFMEQQGHYYYKPPRIVRFVPAGD